jgi:hypothetical protein
MNRRNKAPVKEMDEQIKDWIFVIKTMYGSLDKIGMVIDEGKFMLARADKKNDLALARKLRHDIDILTKMKENRDLRKKRMEVDDVVDQIHDLLLSKGFNGEPFPENQRSGIAYAEPINKWINERTGVNNFQWISDGEDISGTVERIKYKMLSLKYV